MRENGVATSNGGLRRVAPERTGWRDEAISLRHRQWGFNCPAVDLDFVMVEYDSGKVCAIVEYKNEFAAVQYLSHPSYRAIVDLANAARVPFFVCRYTSNFAEFKAIPANDFATRYVKEPSVRLTEKEWVALLYEVRGRAMPADLFDQAV